MLADFQICISVPLNISSVNVLQHLAYLFIPYFHVLSKRQNLLFSVVYTLIWTGYGHISFIYGT